LVNIKEASEKEVKCPYCKADSSEIDIGQTTVTLLYSDLFPIFNPNTFSTEYNCRNCKKRFWISRKIKLIEEYVFEKDGKTKRVRKTYRGKLVAEPRELIRIVKK